MRKKDLERIRVLLSRRRALQGMSAVLGATAVGCADDASGDAGNDSTSGSTGSSSSTSTSTSTTSTDGTVDGSSGDGSTSGSSDATGSESSSTGEPIDECGGTSEMTPEELLEGIDTIVVVMMENRSFDHYFGSAAFLEAWQIDGLDGTESNADLGGVDVVVFNLENFEPADPPHGWEECHLQWNLGANDGFVIQHELNNPMSKTEVMGYHVRNQIQTLYALADNYTLCDRWFCSVMGPTWPNRFYLHAANSNGQQGNAPEPGLTTIWDALDNAGVSASNYYSDVPWAWGAFANPLLSYTNSLDEFFAAAAAGELPQFVVIDPNFGILGGGGNDDHPSHNIMLGQMFLASIYAAMAQSPQWDRCLLVITYDEHGGFYDHVSPPETVDDNPGFEQLGFRVPSLVIGPTVRRGCVNSTQFEHVSVIATATVKFGLAPLNARVSATNDLTSCINPAYVGNPQPPAAIPMLTVSRNELFHERYRGTSQHELAEMVADGRIPLPADRRHPDADRELAERLLAHAERLGVVKILP